MYTIYICHFECIYILSIRACMILDGQTEIIQETIQKIIRVNFCILFSQKKTPLMKSHLRFFLCCFGVCLFPLSTVQAYYLFYFFFISLILQISELEFFAWTIKISKNQFNQPTTKMKWRKKTNKKFKTFEIQKQIKLVK